MTTHAADQGGPRPRQRRADGERTRRAILSAAASLATVDGLEGLSIGNLAAATGISKSGLYAHFGSKQELLRSFAATAVEQHELPAHEDPDLLAFELHSILLGADTKFVLHDDPAALDLARQVVHQRPGLDNATAGYA
jgi:AcrR family transcriptional regulator